MNWTPEQAKDVLDNHYGEMTGLEKALYRLVEDLQTRVAQLERKESR